MDALLGRALGLARAGRAGPAILGITGAPGAGKSTLAARLASLVAEEISVALLPMDGFHLSDAVLARLGRSARKGAIDTFDGWGYAALLARLRAESGRSVFAPGFERGLEQALAGDVEIPAGTRLVITEGNYLLAPDEPWAAARSLMDEVWCCVLDADVRAARLVERHVRFGKTPGEASRWVRQVDQANAALVEAWAGAADVLVDMAKMEPPHGAD
jgi:pantothenate kinase